MQYLDFDPDLIRRHGCRGPRYTSYPTARQFESHFDLERYRQEVVLSNNDPIPARLSLYVHLPFCNNPCFYCGCNRLITREPEKLARYLDRVLREAALQGALFDRDREVLQLHLGGGTPTLYTDDELTELWHGLAQAFRLAERDRLEASIEVDPRGVTAARLDALAGIGFNRVSFGIQDFDPQVQEAVNRVQDPQHCLELIARAKTGGFDSVSVDLIYGLPRQTLEGFGATLDSIAAARPGRVAVYAYAHLPEHFKAQRQIADAELPGPELRLQLLGLVVARLTAAGYEYIGMDHFALPDDELAAARRNGGLQRNFQGYSTHAGLDLVGLGMSAIGHVRRVFTQNAKRLDGYYAALEAGQLPVVNGLVQSQDDCLRAEVINGLMCYDEVRYSSLEQAYKIRFTEYFAAELQRLAPLAADGLVALEPGRLRVLPRGRFLLRSLAMQFDAYLPAGGPAAFSHVI